MTQRPQAEWYQGGEVERCTVSVIRKFPFRLSFTIVERSLNDRETVHVRSAYDRTVVFVYAHADYNFPYTLSSEA